MIPAWILKRAGEVESFLKRINKGSQLRPSLEIYSTSNGDAIGINYEHPFFDELEYKFKEDMVISFLNSPRFDAEKKELYTLYERWHILSSWRAYKQDRACGCWSSGLRVWYCSEVEENDISQLREIYDWVDGGFTQEEFELLKKYSDKNAAKRANDDFQQCAKAIKELLEKDLRFWYRTISDTISLVASVCKKIDNDRNKSIAKMLKLPLRDISDTPEIAETFILIKKLQNCTSKNIELVDAYDDLSALVRDKRTDAGCNRPMRFAKEALQRIKHNLEWVDVQIELQEQKQNHKNKD